MEFHISESGRKISIDWNGPVDLAHNRTITTSISRAHKMKILLFLPKMPTNHMLCMVRRLRKNWSNSVGLASRGSRKALTTVKKYIHQDKIETDDAILIQILEELTLDDVGTDLDLIAVKKKTEAHRISSTWIFAFAPDDLSHFIDNSRIHQETLCYGRNGDNDLE